MDESVATAALSERLGEARDHVRVVSARVEDAATAAPRRDRSGWDGPAADAYQHGLDQLSRDLDAIRELLRSAGDLLGAAVWELGGHA